MAEQINIVRKIFGKSSFENVIDTQFKELVPMDRSDVIQTDTDVPKFFKDYDNLFYDIPVTGSNVSHEELIKRSSEYLGISLSDMKDEIENLREENVSLKNQLFLISQNI